MRKTTITRPHHVCRLLQPARRISGTTVHINIEALQKNLRCIRQTLSPQSRLMFVVKKDGYGHGILPAALAAQREKVSALAVFHIEEGLLLREAGIRLPILILSPSANGLLKDAIAQGLHLTVINATGARDIERVSVRCEKPAFVHLKLDTGLGRMGFEPSAIAKEDVARMLTARNLRLHGVYSHLACGREDLDYSRRQLAELRNFMAVFGHHKPLVHIASSGVLPVPEFHLDMVRIGIAGYGISQDLPGLEPVMRVTAPVLQVKTVKAAQSIGYCRTYRTIRRARIATIGAGYGDGYPVALSNKGWVDFKGQRLPVVGRICMDQLMVDATHALTIAPGSEVELIGRAVCVAELATAANTISYELLCSLGAGRKVVVEIQGEHRG